MKVFEQCPIEGEVRLGVEWEGAFQLTSPRLSCMNAEGTWSEEEALKGDHLRDFANILKAKPIIWYFAKEPVDFNLNNPKFDNSRGVFLTAEQSKDAINIPGELVSAPHGVDLASLKVLRQAINSAGGKNAISRGEVDPKDDKRQLLNFIHHGKRYRLTLRSTKNPRAVFGGNMQVTIGICVVKLFAPLKADRHALIDAISPQQTSAYIKLFVDLACKLQKYFCEELSADELNWSNLLRGILFEKNLNSDEDKARLRLAIFMWIARFGCSFVRAKTGNNGKWDKDIYGPNFKGCSSYHGVGLELELTHGQMEAMFKNRIALLEQKDGGEALGDDDDLPLQLMECLKLCIDDLAKGEDTELWNHLLASQGVGIGSEGLAIECAIEGGKPYPNFIANGELHTVVELRWREIPLREKIVEFLGSKDNNDVELFKELSNLSNGKILR